MKTTAAITLRVLIGSDRQRPEAAALPASDTGALWLARRFADAEVQAICRPADPLAQRHAAALGLPISVQAPVGVAAPTDVWLVGRGGADGDLLPAQLAEQHGAALVFGVLELSISGRTVRATRDLGRGARDVLDVPLPAVLVLADSVKRLGYISQHRLQRAAVATAAPAAPDDQTADHWAPTVPRVRLGDHAARTAGSATDRMNQLLAPADDANAGGIMLIQEDAETCARHLQRFLCHHGFLDAEPLAVQQPAAPTTSGGQPDAPAAPGAPTLDARRRRAPRHLADDIAPGAARAPRPYRSAPPESIDGRRHPVPINRPAPTRRGPYPVDA
jgi:hypothetical protein